MAWTWAGSQEPLQVQERGSRTMGYGQAPTRPPTCGREPGGGFREGGARRAGALVRDEDPEGGEPLVPEVHQCRGTGQGFRAPRRPPRGGSDGSGLPPGAPSGAPSTARRQEPEEERGHEAACSEGRNACQGFSTGGIARETLQGPRPAEEDRPPPDVAQTAPPSGIGGPPHRSPRPRQDQPMGASRISPTKSTVPESRSRRRNRKGRFRLEEEADGGGGDPHLHRRHRRRLRPHLVHRHEALLEDVRDHQPGRHLGDAAEVRPDVVEGVSHPSSLSSATRERLYSIRKRGRTTVPSAVRRRSLVLRHHAGSSLSTKSPGSIPAPGSTSVMAKAPASRREVSTT